MSAGLFNQVNHDESGSKVSGGVLVQFLGLLWKELSREEIEFITARPQITTNMLQQLKEKLTPQRYRLGHDFQRIAPSVLVCKPPDNHHHDSHCHICNTHEDVLHIAVRAKFETTHHIYKTKWTRVSGDNTLIRLAADGESIEVRHLPDDRVQDEFVEMWEPEFETTLAHGYLVSIGHGVEASVAAKSEPHECAFCEGHESLVIKLRRYRHGVESFEWVHLYGHDWQRVTWNIQIRVDNNFKNTIWVRNRKF